MIGASHLLLAIAVIFATFLAMMIVKLIERGVTAVSRRRRLHQPRMRTRCRMRASR